MSLQNKQAQKELQDYNDVVKIKIGKIVCDGFLRGKKLDWPMIYIPELNQSVEFAWSTVYTAIQNNLVLIA